MWWPPALETRVSSPVVHVMSFALSDQSVAHGHGTVRVSDHVEVYYETWGNPADPPVLFVQGLGGCLRHWPENTLLAPMAARGLYVMAYDNRDSGRSSRVTRCAVPPIHVQMLRFAANALVPPNRDTGEPLTKKQQEKVAPHAARHQAEMHAWFAAAPRTKAPRKSAPFNRMVSNRALVGFYGLPGNALLKEGFFTQRPPAA